MKYTKEQYETDKRNIDRQLGGSTMVFTIGAVLAGVGAAALSIAAQPHLTVGAVTNMGVGILFIAGVFLICALLIEKQINKSITYVKAQARMFAYKVEKLEKEWVE